MNPEQLKKKIGADCIYSDGRFAQDDKDGILNLETGEIIREAFADVIYSNGTFRQDGKYGIVNLKTGEIIKEAE